MNQQIKFLLTALWSGIIAFTFPICLGIIYMDITGHGKGYGYNLGSEKDIHIFFGFIELIIWLALAVPPNIYLLRQLRNKKPSFIFIPVLAYIVLFILCVYLVIGGWGEFGKFFNL